MSQVKMLVTVIIIHNNNSTVSAWLGKATKAPRAIFKGRHH